MPGSIRLFVTGPLTTGGRVTLSQGQGHYLLRVMRRAVGDPLVLFDGVSGEFAATLAVLDRRGASAELGARTRAQADGPDVWLAFALLKRDATDLVVRQATEMGVAEIRPVITARTNAAHTNLDRLRAIATEAAEQSERLTMPVVCKPVAFDALLAEWPQGRMLFAAIERAGDPASPIAGPRAALIGPEGGFAAQEVVALRRCGFVRTISLGPTILRAETAAVASLARIA